MDNRDRQLSYSVANESRNVKQAIEILTDKDGICMPKSKITVSTSGVAPGLAKLAELGGIGLAISLHATNDRLRNEIVPINKYVGVRLSPIISYHAVDANQIGTHFSVGHSPFTFS